MDDYREQAAAYALGALSDDERRAFDMHMMACAACAAEARLMAVVAAALAYAADADAPAAAVRERVIQSARDD